MFRKTILLLILFGISYGQSPDQRSGLRKIKMNAAAFFPTAGHPVHAGMIPKGQPSFKVSLWFICRPRYGNAHFLKAKFQSLFLNRFWWEIHRWNLTAEMTPERFQKNWGGPMLIEFAHGYGISLWISYPCSNYSHLWQRGNWWRALIQYRFEKGRCAPENRQRLQPLGESSHSWFHRLDQSRKGIILN